MYDDTTTPTAHDLAHAIAAHLPDGWQTVETPHTHTARIVGPDGARVIVRVGEYGADRGRAILTGGLPDGASYDAGDWSRVDMGRITVGADRDPAAIARDMVRRLLPAVATAHHEITGRIAQRVGHERARARLADDLATRAGASVRPSTPSRDNVPRVDWSTSDHGYGYLTPDYDAETVTVELRSIPADRARELADMLRSWSK